MDLEQPEAEGRGTEWKARRVNQPDPRLVEVGWASKIPEQLLDEPRYQPARSKAEKR